MDTQIIKDRIIQGFETGGLDMETMGNLIVSKTQMLTKTGINLDADAIFHAFRLGEKVISFLVIGRSVLAGPDAYQWLLAYQDFNAAEAKNNVAELAGYASEKLISDGECTIPLQDRQNKAWRAFKVQPDGRLKSADEIRRKVSMLRR